MNEHVLLFGRGVRYQILNQNLGVCVCSEPSEAQSHPYGVLMASMILFVYRLHVQLMGKYACYP